MIAIGNDLGPQKTPFCASFSLLWNMRNEEGVETSGAGTMIGVSVRLERSVIDQDSSCSGCSGGSMGRSTKPHNAFHAAHPVEIH